MGQPDKKVDADWKEKIEKEKQEQKQEEPLRRQEPDFKFFVTTLALQSSICLGHMPNPATQKTEQDLTQAKFLIDTLSMLKEKTKGNLTGEEEQLLENLLYELRTAYLAAKGQ